MQYQMENLGNLRVESVESRVEIDKGKQSTISIPKSQIPNPKQIPSERSEVRRLPAGSHPANEPAAVPPCTR